MKQPHHVLVIFLSHERSVSRGHAKNGIKILEGACTITLHKRIPNPFSTPAKSPNGSCERGAGYLFVAAILSTFSGRGRSSATTAVPSKEHGHNEGIAEDPESFRALPSL